MNPEFPLPFVQVGILPMSSKDANALFHFCVSFSWTEITSSELHDHKCPGKTHNIRVDCMLRYQAIQVFTENERKNK